MKNIMRAISLGLVCAIATSNVAQAGLWQKTKDAACKINPSALAIASAGLLGASVGYGLACCTIADVSDNVSLNLPQTIAESGAYAPFKNKIFIESNRFLFVPDRWRPLEGFKCSIKDEDWALLSPNTERSLKHFSENKGEIGHYGCAVAAGFHAIISVANAFNQKINSSVDNGILWCGYAAALSVAGLGLSYLIKKERDKRDQQSQVN